MNQVVASFPMYVLLHASFFLFYRGGGREPCQCCRGGHCCRWLALASLLRQNEWTISSQCRTFSSLVRTYSMRISSRELFNLVCSVFLHFHASYCALMLPKLHIYYGQDAYLHDMSLNYYVEIFWYSQFQKSMLPLCRLCWISRYDASNMLLRLISSLHKHPSCVCSKICFICLTHVLLECFMLLYFCASCCFIAFLFVVKSNNPCFLNFCKAGGSGRKCFTDGERGVVVDGGTTCGMRSIISVASVRVIGLEAN